MLPSSENYNQKFYRFPPLELCGVRRFNLLVCHSVTGSCTQFINSHATYTSRQGYTRTGIQFIEVAPRPGPHLVPLNHVARIREISEHPQI